MATAKKIPAILLSLTLSFGLLSGCASNSKSPKTSEGTAPITNQASQAKEFKVGLVSDTGGVNDHTINQLAYSGLKTAEATLGVKTSLIQSKSASDYVPNITRFAQDGYDMIIVVGFTMSDAVTQLSKQYPQTKFVILDQSIDNIPNVAGVTFKTEECGYLVGALVGLLKQGNKVPGLNEKNVVGVVGGLPIPPVDSYIAGFQQGVQKTNPKVAVNVKYAGKFDDAALGSQITQQLISEGSDFVFPVAGGTGNGVINAAKSANIYAIGVDADQNYLAPNTVITSAMKNVDKATVDMIKDAKEGYFKSGTKSFDLSNGGVSFVSNTQLVPKEILDQVTSLIGDIKSGKIQISPIVKK
ncbi:BMP family lipoprotein [Paenibacillus alginolyticus]|uniref:BMP family ABC transporter substrate-binding protein n=1 Tax=Paenibacillus alginolyticus TaxID=59839 RepID=A0ABT4GAH3_9BACL|nr:BMP family ABC transporter substrate-binding protein [Paenibacillus alginolyticus]MCY9693196.1 BMP family ABC transporter substrate-binding protein [Paenibacillus alginolyticus]MEC0144509.1 BMP family ABC transporter substrate-binding protein [Paenibacillus alginolyticus]